MNELHLSNNIISQFSIM